MREVWGNCGVYGKGLDSEQANAYLCDWQSPTLNPKVRFHGTNWPCAEGRLHVSLLSTRLPHRVWYSRG